MASKPGDAGLAVFRVGLPSVVLAIALTVLAGWSFQVPALKSVIPGLTTMKANTALCLVFAALALLLAGRESMTARRGAAAVALILGVLAFATLLEYGTGLNLAIDERLFSDAETTSRPFPGRMSPASAASFLAASASLLLLSLGERRPAVALGHALAAVPAAVGLLSLAGYAYGVKGLYAFGPYVAVALNTAMALVLVSIGLVLTRATQGWAHNFVGAPIARIALRRIAVLAIVLPFATGMVVVSGIRAGYYQGLFASALFAVAASAALLWTAFLCATILSRSERQIAAAQNLATRVALDLENSQERYRTLVDGLPQLVWTSDAEGQCDYLSAQWAHYAGSEPTAAQAFAWVKNLLHPDDRGTVMGAWMSSVQNRSVYDVEVRFRRADGAYRWFKSTALPLSAPGDDRPCWLGTCTDIQEIVEAREVLSRSRAELEAEVAVRTAAQSAAEELRRTAFQNSQIFQALFDVGGVVLELNATALSTIEVEAEAVVGRHFSETPWFISVDPDAATLELVVRAVGEGATLREEMVLDLPAGRRVFDCAFAPIRNPVGAVVAIMVEAVELTERRAAEAQLIGAREAAERSAQSEADFLANMSHELRTPLNSIMGFSGLVADASELLPETRRRAKLVQTSSQALLAIVNDILDLSRLEAEGVSLVLEPIDLESLMISTVDLVRAQAESDGVRVAVHLTATPKVRLLDGARLRQILLNLLSNAIKFTPKGTVTLSLVELEDGRLKIAVRDTGIGIGPDKLGRIFQRFAQADGSTSRTYGGTGLGLAISKALIEAMGGTIGAESEEGEGSCFWITLDPPAADGVAPAVAPTPRLALAPGLRVLLVDDNAMNRELFCALMRNQHLEIVEAQNGVEAVEAVCRERFDIVFMDIQMPRMCGVEATRRIRELGWVDLPIVALTANVMDKHVASYLDAGLSDHVAKPFVAATILAAFKRWTDPQSAEVVDTVRPFENTVLRDLADAIGTEGVDRFLDGVCGQLRDMLTLLKDAAVDPDQIKRTAHSVRGLAGSLGLTRLYDDYSSLEKQCEAPGSLHDLSECAEAITRANIAVIDEIRAA